MELSHGLSYRVRPRIKEGLEGREEKSKTFFTKKTNAQQVHINVLSTN